MAKIDSVNATKMAERLLDDLKNENYASLNDYYTSSFNEGEPLKKKVEKFKQLAETMGSILSYSLISSKERRDEDLGVNELMLKYKVVCKKVAVEETFLIISDEGKEKIMFQNIENMK